MRDRGIPHVETVNHARNPEMHTVVFPIAAPTLKFNPSVRLDTSQIQDRRGAPPIKVPKMVPLRRKG